MPVVKEPVAFSLDLLPPPDFIPRPVALFLPPVRFSFHFLILLCIAESRQFTLKVSMFVNINGNMLFELIFPRLTASFWTWVCERVKGRNERLARNVFVSKKPKGKMIGIESKFWDSSSLWEETQENVRGLIIGSNWVILVCTRGLEIKSEKRYQSHHKSSLVF